MRKGLRHIVCGKPIVDAIALVIFGSIILLDRLIQRMKRRRKPLWQNSDLTERAAQSVLYPRYSALPARLERRIQKNDEPKAGKVNAPATATHQTSDATAKTGG